MKLIRFMSKLEYVKFIQGEVLTNTTNHHELAGTNSVGFCFFEGDEKQAEYNYQFVSGIVSYDYVCIFETDAKNVEKSYGIYAEPLNEDMSNFRKPIVVDEYCTKEYNNKNFKLISYCNTLSFFSGYCRWEWKDV